MNYSKTIKFLRRLFKLRGDDLISETEFGIRLRKAVRNIGGELSDIIVPGRYTGEKIYNISNQFILVYTDGFIEIFYLRDKEYYWKSPDKVSECNKFWDFFKIQLRSKHQVDTVSQWKEFSKEIYKLKSRNFYHNKIMVDLGNYVFNALIKNPNVSNIRVDFNTVRFRFKYKAGSTNREFYGLIDVDYTSNREPRFLVEFEHDPSYQRVFIKYLYSKDKLNRILSILSTGQDNFKE